MDCSLGINVNIETENEKQAVINVDAEQDRKEILLALNRAEDELKKINNHKLIKIYNSVYKLLFLHFLKGVTFGLGSVLGATIVVSVVLYLLSQIEFVPIIGEWVQHIIAEIEAPIKNDLEKSE